MIYRLVLAAMALQLFLPCFGEEFPLVEEFAKGYVSAIKTKDEKVIFEKLYPGTFEKIPPEQVAFIKRSWMKQISEAADKLTEPMRVKVDRLDLESKILPDCRWAIRPEYQIDIEPYKKTNFGEETTGFGMVDLVVFKDGRFYIVLPIPPESTIVAAMKKEAQQAENPSSIPPPKGRFTFIAKVVSIKEIKKDERFFVVNIPAKYIQTLHLISTSISHPDFKAGQDIKFGVFDRNLTFFDLDVKNPVGKAFEFEAEYINDGDSAYWDLGANKIIVQPNVPTKVTKPPY